MQQDSNKLIATLLSDLFQIPPELLQSALAIVENNPDRSLLDALCGMGALNESDRALLDAVLGGAASEEAPTRTRMPDEAGANPDMTALSGLWRTGTDCGDAGGTRYVVQGEHARGGMGRIFTVWDRAMRREIALKELLPEEGASGDAGRRALARFLREARITGRLQHPSIVPVHEIGVRAGGVFYYTMKLIRGETLRQAIADAGSLEARMALLPHYRDLCLAVAYAHAHGVIHRDIKPSNVMIGEFGETQVIDWGLAREIGALSGGAPLEEGAAATFDVADADLTRGGQLLGTPHYMPPEQAAGHLELLDERSDVYSLGSVLYELLTGERPYQALSGLEVLGRVSAEPPAPPETLCPDAPPALVAICRRAMAREPAQRYPTAAEVAAEVEDFQAGFRVSAHDYSLIEVASLFFRRHRAAVVTACIAAVLLATLGAYTYVGLRTRHAVEHDLRVQSDQKRYDMAILLAQDALEGHRYGEARQLLAGAPPAYRNWEWGHLNQVLGDVQDRIATDQGRIMELLVHPDGGRVVTVDAAGGAQLRALDSGARLRAYPNEDGATSGAALHPEGSEFALRLARGSVVRWDTDSGAPLPGFELGAGTGTSLLYTADGNSILAGAGSEILQWSSAEDRVVRHFSTEGGTVNDLAHAPDKRWLAAAMDTGDVYVWDWATGASVFHARAHPERQETAPAGALQVAFNADSTQMVTAGSDTIVKLWNTGDWTLNHTLSRHLMRVLSAAFSPDGNTLMTQSARAARFWDPRTGNERPSWIRGEQSYVRMRYSTDGTRLIAAGDGDGLTLWNLNAPPSGLEFKAHPVEVNSVQFSPDSRYLISGAGHWQNGGDGRVLAWDLHLGPLPIAAGVFSTNARWVNQAAFHPVAPQLTAVDSQGSIITFDCKTGARARTIQVPEYTGGARCLVYSPDGALMATSGWDDGHLATVTLWKTQSGTRLRDLRGADHFIESIAFGPDAGLLAAGSRDGMVHIWSVADGQHLRRFPLDEGWVCGVAFAPHGRLLAAACDSSAVLVLDPETGNLRHRLDGMILRVNDVSFSPDGQRVAACDDRFVRIWNSENGAPLLAIPFGARDIAFSPDGGTLAAGGVDGHIGLWRAAISEKRKLRE